MPVTEVKKLTTQLTTPGFTTTKPTTESVAGLDVSESGRPDSTRRAPENRRFECAQSGRERWGREERASTGDPLNPIQGIAA